MPQKIRMWEVTSDNSLSEITSSEINLEKQLEDWLESDISMLDSDLMVIGRQVRTDFGGEIDLLCLDSTGALVAVELKKGQTPREVTAQALDYASWVKDLSFNRIVEIAEKYKKLDSSLEEAFQASFGDPLPDTLNQSHRALIVAEAMDDSTERIVRYLSDLNVPINIATVQYYKTQDGRQLLAQVYLVEHEQSGNNSNKPTLELLRNVAIGKGVAEIYDKLFEHMHCALKKASPTKSGVSFRETFDSGRAQVVFKLMPPWSAKDKGLRFQLFAERLATAFTLGNSDISALLPTEHWNWTPWPDAPESKKSFWAGYEGYFKTHDEVDKFLSALNE